MVGDSECSHVIRCGQASSCDQALITSRASRWGEQWVQQNEDNSSTVQQEQEHRQRRSERSSRREHREQSGTRVWHTLSPTRLGLRQCHAHRSVHR